MNGVLSPSVLVTVLPGPDRKRTRTCYRYKVVYRDTHPHEPGCVMVWEVTGGREPYQIALERQEHGRTKYHCTCADAAFRSETIAKHSCKHVRGLMECMPPGDGRSAA